MSIHRVAYLGYVAIRKVIRTLGITGPLRKVLGPIAGRLILRLAVKSDTSLMIHGHQMTLATGAGYPPLGMVMGNYEEETTRLFQSLIKPEMVIIDIGAHVGYYSLLAARQIGPSGKVYAFEPDPDNYALLVKNVEQNGYANVVTTNKAVADSVGHLTFFLTALDSGRNSIYSHGLPERGTIDVETTTIDSYFGEEGWPHIDLVKIDVEGAEINVLDGMVQLVEKSDGLRIIIELNPSLLKSAGVDPVQLIERPTSLGSNVSVINEKEGLLPLSVKDAPGLISGLLAEDSSVNLLWTKQ